MMKIKKWVCICLSVVAAWKLSVSFHNIFFTWNYQKVGQRDVIFFFTEFIDAFECIGAMNAWVFFDSRIASSHVFVTSFTDLFILLNLNQKWNWKWRWLRHWLGLHHDCIRLLQKWPISGFDEIPCFTVSLKKVQIVNKHVHLFGSFVLARSQNIITHEFYSLISHNQFWFWFWCLEIWIHFFMKTEFPYQNNIDRDTKTRFWLSAVHVCSGTFSLRFKFQQTCWLLSYSRPKCQEALLRIIIIEWWRKKMPRGQIFVNLSRQLTDNGRMDGWKSTWKFDSKFSYHLILN